jgi:hypothetical protein
MIVAMGIIELSGYAHEGRWVYEYLVEGYNVTKVTWDEDNMVYRVKLTGIDYDTSQYMTVATPNPDLISIFWCTTDDSEEGELLVACYDIHAEMVKKSFSFVVYQMP